MIQGLYFERDLVFIALGVCNITIKGRMSKLQHNQAADDQHQFVKGMTLGQYMANSHFDKPQLEEEQQEDTIEDSLYENSHYGCRETLMNKKRNYKIDEIDEESVEDSKDYQRNDGSKDYQRHEETIETPDFEPVEKHNLNSEQSEHGKALKGRANSMSMSTAITFKNTRQDTNNFRIKRLSISPAKKKLQMPTPLPSASITLYGCKFGQPTPNQSKMPEMLTFYGKLNLESGEEMLHRKTSVKKSQLQQKFKKKSQLELNKVLQFQSSARGTCGYKNYQDLRVEGFRDRRNKFM